MKSDIKNTFKVYKYPELDITIDTTLTTDQIIEQIEQHQRTFVIKFDNNESYFIGVNRAIVNKANDDEYAPDNRITVPYARTLNQIVKGYMYKPSLISYSSDNEDYVEQLQDIFDKNYEPLKTSELGEDQGKYGIAFELLFTDNDIVTTENEGETQTELKAFPMFIKCNPQEIIPIYQRSLNKKLICFIRYYVVEDTTQDTGKNEQERKKVWIVEIYYKNKVEVYDMVEKDRKKEIIFKEEYEHFFGDVPLSIFINNEEFEADHEPIVTLMDAYDKLISSATNEEDRFSSAYLVLKNYILANSNDENEKRQIMERLKKFRVFEVQDDGEIKFLTKDIPSQFLDFLRNVLKEDIQFHSHIPDFRSQSFQAASGEAMKWALFDFENLCAGKQAYAEIGLQNRIKLINNFLGIKAIDTDKVTIKFERNLPSNDTMQIDNVIKLKNTELLSDESLLYLLPKDMVDNPQEELEKLDAQKKKNIEMFDFENMKADGEEVVSGEAGEKKQLNKEDEDANI